MKYIKMEVLTINNDLVKDLEFDFRKQLLECVQRFPEGATIEQMRQFFDLNAKLKKAQSGEWLELENEEHRLLCGKVKEIRFTHMADELFRFLDAVTNATDINPIVRSAEKPAVAGGQA